MKNYCVSKTPKNWFPKLFQAFLTEWGRGTKIGFRQCFGMSWKPSNRVPSCLSWPNSLTFPDFSRSFSLTFPDFTKHIYITKKKKKIKGNTFKKRGKFPDFPWLSRKKKILPDFPWFSLMLGTLGDNRFFCIRLGLPSLRHKIQSKYNLFYGW